jgi:hypothetical protein
MSLNHNQQDSKNEQTDNFSSLFIEKFKEFELSLNLSQEVTTQDKEFLIEKLTQILDELKSEG